jgi:hypothetical protein
MRRISGGASERLDYMPAYLSALAGWALCRQPHHLCSQAVSPLPVQRSNARLKAG